MLGLLGSQVRTGSEVKRGPSDIPNVAAKPFLVLSLFQLLPEEVILPLELFYFHQVAFILIELAG